MVQHILNDGYKMSKHTRLDQMIDCSSKLQHKTQNNLRQNQKTYFPQKKTTLIRYLCLCLLKATMVLKVEQILMILRW